MKAYVVIFVLVITGIIGCNRHPKENLKISEVTFPPPVPARDEMVSQKFAPIYSAVEGEESTEEIRIDKPVDNPNVTSLVKEGADTIKKIIKEGEISFESINVIETRKKILASLKGFGGYVDDDSEDTDGIGGRKEFVLSIKIPAKNFDAF